MYLFLSEKQIVSNWESIKADPHNNRPDIRTPERYIIEARAGKVKAGGALVVVQDNLTTCNR